MFAISCRVPHWQTHDSYWRVYYNTKGGYLNTSFSLLPEYLKSCCDYSTHAIGKWHLGFNTISTLPTSRGFDTHLGYWNALEDNLHHKIYSAYDFQDQLEPAFQFDNTYSTDIFAQRAVDIITNHDEKPFFLYVAFQDVHFPTQAPQEYIDRYANATDGNTNRQIMIAQAAHLDDGIGRIIQALQSTNQIENTLIVFTSDNGGPTNNAQPTFADNFPFRGGKNTLFEGGTKVLAIVKGAGIKKTNYWSKEKMYATDWLPTLVSMASNGQDWRKFTKPGEPAFLEGDGVDMWKSISLGAPSARDYILLETSPADSADRGRGDAIIIGDWKLMKIIDNDLNAAQDGWYPPPGEDISTVKYSIACASDNQYQTGDSPRPKQCQETWCLFNLVEDPCEYNDVAIYHAEIVSQMMAKLQILQGTAVQEGAFGVDPVIIEVDGQRVWRPSDLA